MNRIVVILGCCALILGLAACSSDKKKASDVPATTTSIANASSSSAPASSTTTSTTLEFPTTSFLPCQPLPIPTTPVKGPPATKSVLLTKVQNITDGCVDHVVFDFIGKGTDLPGYSITYGSPPFSNSESGQPVAVPGQGFIVVTVKPGYGFDFENGKPTYTGPKSIVVAGAPHVQSIVETGDFEGVLTWVIGTKGGRRAFSVQATGTPRHQLVVTVS